MTTMSLVRGCALIALVIGCSSPSPSAPGGGGATTGGGAGGHAVGPCVPGDELPCLCPNGDPSTQECIDPGAWGACKGCSSPSGSSSSGDGGMACTPMTKEVACAGDACGLALDGCGSSIVCGVCGELTCFDGACCAPTLSCLGQCAPLTTQDNCGAALNCDADCGSGDDAPWMYCAPSKKCVCTGAPAMQQYCPNGTAAMYCGKPPNEDAVGCDSIGPQPDSSSDVWCCSP